MKRYKAHHLSEVRDGEAKKAGTQAQTTAVLKRRPGRPSVYSDAIADDLCEWLAAGKSLRSWADQPGKPAAATVLRWLAMPEHAQFRELYARAREAQADVLFDETVDIADTARATADDVHKARLRIDTRKWVAAKLRPKVYGDRIDVDQTVRLADVSGEPLDAAGWLAAARDRVAAPGGTAESADRLSDG